MICINHLNIFTILLFSTAFHKVASNHCPGAKSSKFPYFTNPMIISKIVTLNSWVDITCCVDGFTGIKWTFKQSKTDRYTDLSQDCELSESGTYVKIKYFRPELDGYYTCNATDDAGNWVANTTLLKMGCSAMNSDMVIYPQIQRKDFFEHEKGKLCVMLSTLQPIVPIMTLWTFQSSYSENSWDSPLIDSGQLLNKTLPSQRGFVWLLRTNLDHICVKRSISMETCIEFTDLIVNDTGIYNVTFQRIDEMVLYSIHFTVSKKLNYFVDYAVSCAIPGVLIFILIVFVWIFYYDIVIMYRKQFLNSNIKMKTDLLIVYDDRDISNIVMAMTISKEISEFGVTTFVFDCHKQYGANIYDDCQAAISTSSKTLFILTQSCMSSPLVLYFFKNCNQRKIFIFNPTRRKILRALRKDEGIEVIYDVVEHARDYWNWNDRFMNMSYVRTRFYKWLLSHLIYKQCNKIVPA